MKDSSSENITSIQSEQLSKENNAFPINYNSFISQINSDTSNDNYFKLLKEKQEVRLNIINSKISIKETTLEKNIIFSQIEEIIKKYENHPLININKLTNKSLIPVPLFDEVNDFSRNYPYISSKDNLIPNSVPNLIHQINSNYSFPELSIKEKENNLYNNNNNLTNYFTNLSNITFLNQKRKTPFVIDDEKKYTNFKYKIFITTSNNEKSDEEKINSEINSEKNEYPKKVIFRMDKKFRNYKEERIKKNPGRKKKNSGEIGIHNKFSKDNMMRKLKNKVIESARRLINKMIKIESGEEYKYLGEMRKIQGVFCQELNIKFNFWFYVQKLKTIFQFKMSTKYSKGDFDSNAQLISKIYSEKYKNKFPRTIKLLDMMFHQYLHEIFLGEKNWTNEFEISEEDNQFGINYFLKNKLDENKNDLFYLEKMNKLAIKYELFFLNKNPRIYSNKNEEKISQIREIIKKISQQDYEKYKYYFISKSVFYLPDIKSSYVQYLNKYKDIYQNNFEIKEKTRYNNIFNTKAEQNFHENNQNENIKKIKINSNNKEMNIENEKKDKSNPSKNNLFDVEKYVFFKKNKNVIKKEKTEIKKINFFINRNEKGINIKNNNISKDNKTIKEDCNAKTNLFIINREK
jgi:hypothetical protein